MIKAKSLFALLGAVSLGVIVPGCGTSEGSDGEGNGPTETGSDAECKVDSDFGCAGATQDAVREVVSGPAVKSTDAEVWKPVNKWDAKTNEAGIAWEANSGLTWEEKYAKWVSSLEQVRGRNYDTVQLKTPQGRVIGSAVLECADQSIFFRFTFAAWYKLPFFMSGWVNGQNAYFGHMGVVDKSGNPMNGFPLYRTRYQDNETNWRSGSAWPKDSALRGRDAGYNDSHTGILVDGNPLPEGARFGAYLDELFLNKRAGHLLSILVAYFGSTNLADGANTFQVKGTAIRPGDALVKRWQKEGIGHVLPVYLVETNPDGTKKVSGLQGSMPAHEAEFLKPERYHPNFSSSNAGGDGQTYDSTPIPYTKLGGGLRRWRAAADVDGRWSNTVPMPDRSVYIEDGDTEALLARWNDWKNVLRTGSPQEAYQVAKDNLLQFRNRLHEKPASCSARTERETAWTQVITAGLALDKTEEQIRRENSNDEDFVFAELIYNQSKTCCWLTPGAEQYEVIRSYFEKERDAARDAGTCQQPTVFRATDGNYDLWKAHAAEIGKAWPEAWTQDESPCPAADAAGTDPLTPAGGRAYCTEQQ